MGIKEAYAYCSESGKSFQLKDLFEENDCKRIGDLYLCDCHNIPLVQDYPFVITASKT
jgi:hypothetical protein